METTPFSPIDIRFYTLQECLSVITEIASEKRIMLLASTGTIRRMNASDWINDLINDAYESRSEIEPNYTARKIVPVLTIYNLLPKKNCKECGEPSCMAFAAKLNKFDAEIDGCPLFGQSEYAQLRVKLKSELE